MGRVKGRKGGGCGGIWWEFRPRYILDLSQKESDESQAGVAGMTGNR